MVDFIRDFLIWFKCAGYLHAYESGILLRFGAPVAGSRLWWRPLGCVLVPGRLYLHWPFKVEEVLHHTVCSDPTVMPEQSVTTSDLQPVTLTPVITFEIEDVRQLLLGVSTLEAALNDSVCGVVTTMALKHTWAEIVADDFIHDVEKKVRARAKRHGLKVSEVAFRDMAKCRTIRLLQGHQAQAHEHG